MCIDMAEQTGKGVFPDCLDLVLLKTGKFPDEKRELWCSFQGFLLDKKHLRLVDYC
jgi:hypothetical protein